VSVSVIAGLATNLLNGSPERHGDTRLNKSSPRDHHKLLGDRNGNIGSLFYTPPCRATRLGVEATVANDLRMMLEEIACTPWSERLLVRHHAQGHLPTQGLTPFASIEERKERCRGAGLHIAGTAAVNLAVDKVSAPRVMSPAFSGSDWENVDVPIEGENPTRFARGKIGDDILA